MRPNRTPGVSASAFAFAGALLACTDGTSDGAAGDAEGGSGVAGGYGGALPDTDAGALPTPACVWNAAYQENYTPDDLASILAEARGCYVLVDPFLGVDVQNAVPQIRAAGNVVGCYMSAGTCEDWRADFDALRSSCVDRAWAEWAGEYFVDDTTPALVAGMKARIDQMAAWGCQMVEFDNMDWAQDDDLRAEYGFEVGVDAGITYIRTLCAHARSLGLGCMAKSTADGAADFDGLTVESYPDDMDWWSHDELQGMLDAGGLGLIVHYDATDCDAVLADYRAAYGPRLSFICEDRATKSYRHFDAP
jgi:cysteinyl-tRNA synthetase